MLQKMLSTLAVFEDCTSKNDTGEVEFCLSVLFRYFEKLCEPTSFSCEHILQSPASLFQYVNINDVNTDTCVCREA